MNNKKIFLLLLGALMLIASIILNVKQARDQQASRKRMDALAAITNGGQAKIITRYIHDNVEHVVVKEVQVATKAEKSVAVGNGYLDTLTKALSIAIKRVDEATKVNATLYAENLALKVGALPNQRQYRDKWLKLDYNTDSNTVSLQYDVSLNVAKYWKRHWLIGPKSYYVDLFSDDPRVQVNSVKRFTVKAEKQKRFGLGVNASYSYVPFLNKWEPTLGIGAHYNLVEF